MDVFEFWIPDSLTMRTAKWSPYLVPVSCPRCGCTLKVCGDTPIGPFNALDDPCLHLMHWLDLQAVSTRKHSGPAVCVHCKLVNEHAEPNQPDGGYVCYNCRN